ncbi:MAG TPA: DUF3365 domain-containing protein [Opitutaceae bacterium]|nr:DUF3365 domain-containing protein [Opitutaceae bacterium]
MKPRVSVRVACFLMVQALAPLFAAEAGAPAAGSDIGPVRAVFVPLDAPEVAEVRSLGERAINRLAVSLVTEASSTVARKGLLAALGVCHLRNVAATGAIIPDMPRITVWKRTSLRLRDVANAPDPAERLVLQRIRAELEEGNAPSKLLVQRIDHPDGAKEWRVYRPIAVAAQCLACHGEPDAMSLELREELKARYPSDEAVGYSVGEWRGIVRVTVLDAPAAPNKIPVPNKK